MGKRLHKGLGQVKLGTLDSGERSLPFGLLVSFFLVCKISFLLQNKLNPTPTFLVKCDIESGLPLRGSDGHCIPVKVGKCCHFSLYLCGTYYCELPRTMKSHVLMTFHSKSEFRQVLFPELCFFTQNDGYYRAGDYPRNS